MFTTLALLGLGILLVGGVLGILVAVLITAMGWKEYGPGDLDLTAVSSKIGAASLDSTVEANALQRRS
jgi:hypothetical protein